jgi:hypothetical protein
MNAFSICTSAAAWEENEASEARVELRQIMRGF